MIISFKHCFKLIGVAIVVLCAAFVCTIFVNFYLDAQELSSIDVDESIAALIEAQLLTSKLVPAITGGALGVTAVVMLAFYVRLYVNENSVKIGILKAMGYYGREIAASFWVFGLAVFAGAALGYAGALIAMPLVYDAMTIADVISVTIRFHIQPLVYFVIAPTVGFILLIWLYALLCCNRPVGELMKAVKPEKTDRREKEDKERPFLSEMRLKTIKANKLLDFLMFFASFCFSAMVQMSFSMQELASDTMFAMMLIIGLILAVTTELLAVTSLCFANRKNIAMMKALGYSFWENTLSVFGGFVPFSLAGFFVGTAYQYGLLKIMVEAVFKNVDYLPTYEFDFPMFCYTFIAFIVFYAVFNLLYAHKLGKTSAKELMHE